MRRIVYILTLAVVLTAISVGASAKPKKEKKVDELYIYGIAASFNDSTIYFTDIQQMRGVWMDSKKMFVSYSQEYSAQLRNYMESKGMPKRVCTFFYDKKYKKLKKRYDKMKNKYVKSGKYDIRYIDMLEFQFQPITNEENN